MKIIWSTSAKEDLHEIYTYYKVVASVKIAKSIISNIYSKTRALIKHSKIGKIEENENVSGRGYRFLISDNYKIIYQIVDSKSIRIAAIFDCRQNPDKMLNK